MNYRKKIIYVGILMALSVSAGAQTDHCSSREQLAANKAAARQSLDEIAADTWNRLKTMEGLTEAKAKEKGWDRQKMQQVQAAVWFSHEISELSRKTAPYLSTLHFIADYGRLRDGVPPANCDLTAQARELSAAVIANSAAENNLGLRTLETSE